MASITITYEGKTTSVGLVRNINAVGARYLVPTRRFRDALRRIGAPYSLAGLTHDATELFSYHGGYLVSFERRDSPQ